MSTEALNQKFVYIPRSALIASICLHFAVPMSFLVVVGLERLGIHIFPQRKRVSVTDVYQSYIQVDVVGLPDQLMNERTNIDPTLPLVDKPKTDTEPAPEVKTQEQQIEEQMKLMEEKKAEAKKKEDEAMAEAQKKKAAEEKAKAEKLAQEKAAAEKAKKKAKDEALKKLQAEAEREAALKGLAAKGSKKGRLAMKGNLMSKGTAMSGNIGNAKDRYTALVAQKIREHFNIFPWQKKKGLMATVYIEIFPNGRLKEKKLMQASRDPVYDAAVLQAVEESQPLPIPEDMALAADGFRLEFRPEN